LFIENRLHPDDAISHVKQLLETERDLSPALKSALEVMLLLVSVLLNRMTINSKNSSKPPSSDPNRKKGTRKKSDKPSGGRLLHKGKTLQKVEDSDEIEIITIDRRTLPKGHYTEDGFETRQIFDIDISQVVTEYQAQRLINEQGKCFVAPFPKKVCKAVQYGDGIKAHAVYLSQYQLLPYKRIQEYFSDPLQMPISEGSLFNFNQQANKQLAEFETITLLSG
jgi:transposase